MLNPSEQSGQCRRIDVLHVVYCYLPHPLGGTEIYAKSLAEELTKLGLCSAIAAPGPRNEDYEIDGMPIFRIAAMLSIDHLYGQVNPEALARWQRILDNLRPKILHVHARMPMLSSEVLAYARSISCKIIYTTHTPSSFCARGTMMEMGSTVCDGKIETVRCSKCVLQSLGAPKMLANLANSLPRSVARAASALAPQKAKTALLMPQRMQRSLGECHDFFASCDLIIAVCDWIYQALLKNNVPPEKISLNRQGLRSDILAHATAAQSKSNSGALRVFALGRADKHKGFNVLIAAVLKCQADVQLDLALSYGNDDNHGKALAEQLKQQAHGSARVRIHRNLQGHALSPLFAEAHLLAAPSTGLETGPLTVLEGFSQGLPAIGSNQGGIAELIQHEHNGWLVEAGDVRAWQEKLDELAQNPNLLTAAKANIDAVRTMREVAMEHLGIYKRVLGQVKG